MASPVLNIIASIATGRQFIICSSLIIIVLCKLIQGGSVRGVCGRGGAIGASHSKFKQFAMMLWKGHEAHKWKGWRPEWKGWRRSVAEWKGWKPEWERLKEVRVGRLKNAVGQLMEKQSHFYL